MKSVGVLVFCLILSLTLTSLVESRYTISNSAGPVRVVSRSVDNVHLDLTKRGWLKDKVNEVGEKIKKGMDAYGKAIKKFWGKVREGYDKLIG